MFVHRMTLPRVHKEYIRRYSQFMNNINNMGGVPDDFLKGNKGPINWSTIYTIFSMGCPLPETMGLPCRFGVFLGILEF